MREPEIRKTKNNDNLRFQLLRIRRLFIVIVGRTGLWDLCYTIIEGMLKIIKRIRKGRS